MLGFAESSCELILTEDIGNLEGGILNLFDVEVVVVIGVPEDEGWINIIVSDVPDYFLEHLYKRREFLLQFLLQYLGVLFMDVLSQSDHFFYV